METLRLSFDANRDKPSFYQALINAVRELAVGRNGLSKAEPIADQDTPQSATAVSVPCSTLFEKANLRTVRIGTPSAFCLG